MGNTVQNSMYKADQVYWGTIWNYAAV